MFGFNPFLSIYSCNLSVIEVIPLGIEKNQKKFWILKIINIFVPVMRNKGRINTKTRARKRRKAYPKGFPTMIAESVGCSVKYAKVKWQAKRES